MMNVRASRLRSASRLACAIAVAAFVGLHPVEASAEAPGGEGAAFARLLQDTPITLSNGARLVAPSQWEARRVTDGIILGAPEQDSHIAVFSRSESTAAAAASAAWALYRPGLAFTAQGEERPAREGWDKTVRFQIEAPSGDPRTILLFALGKGSDWTVLVYDVSDAVAERRDAQIEVIFNSLLPQGYARESFAGRRANMLDAARIGQLTTMIEEARTDLGIPGVALGLIQNGEVVFAGGFGIRELGRPEAVDASTLFNVASIGKAWTTVMLAKQVEAGRFDWDSPVHTLWPDFQLGDPATTKAVLVRHLVCACTGMPRSDYGWLFEGDNSTPQSVMASLARTQPTSAFSDTYQYSNLMASAGGYFGAAIRHPRRELGAAYDAAMNELVFRPLGMSATTANFSRALAGNHASGHALNVEGRVALADQALNLASVSTRPSGNHWSNVRDILRYMRMELSGGLLPSGRRYIAEDVLFARRTPQVTEGLNEHYGMGLKIDTQWGVKVIHHGGTAAGYRSHMMWLPDHGVGAVILINSDTGGPLRTAFRRRLLEILFDGKPTAVADLARFARLDREATAQDRLDLSIPAEQAAVDTLAANYRNKELGELRVVRSGGRTWFDFGGWRSEVASRKSEQGSARFVTVSPGTSGFEFETKIRNGRRALITREAQAVYVFEERP